MTTAHLRRDPAGLLIITPPDAPLVTDAEPPLDTLVLEVFGGHLTWSLLSGQQIPAAVLDDTDLAQDWLWAIYGEAVALTIADLEAGGSASTAESGRAGIEVVVDAGRPALATAARRLAYAHWAARWWPASTLDAITPLDGGLLAQEIAELTTECEALVDGADAMVEEVEPVRAARANDYALAAGELNTAEFTLATGTSGWDWRRCPPGLIDAAEQAVTWEFIRERGLSTVRVTAVAAPGMTATPMPATGLEPEPKYRTAQASGKATTETAGVASSSENASTREIPAAAPTGAVPAHLRPRALVRTATGLAEAGLMLEGDAWTGAAIAPPGAESGLTVDVYVPGLAAFGAGEAGERQQVREFALDRLRGARENRPDGHLRTEIAAAAADSDF
ncbi:hypothetical protein D5S18_11600 [Nocardia panacis]|uniref:Uncharacterized protein n=1 Tax=Nocardia panacis TaxID=2340916 RepID=A0A3A4KNC8_9NOCA|nr:hypothetical protein [Nocardia panacis]RJO76857.1 hypothetical protein D5S18_11600 [Nocardia panacis]